MKKALIVLLLLMMVTGVFAGCKSTSPTSDTTSDKFHIGIVTGTVTQSEDGYRGGEALAEEYGKVADGGMIEAINWPDNFQAEQETTISNIVGLADDPLMKAIIVSDAVPGTAEAFKQVRAKRSDILLFAGKPMEDPNIIAPVCDVAANFDQLTNAYINVWAAKQMGAKTLVFYFVPASHEPRAHQPCVGDYAGGGQGPWHCDILRECFRSSQRCRRPGCPAVHS